MLARLGKRTKADHHALWTHSVFGVPPHWVSVLGRLGRLSTLGLHMTINAFLLRNWGHVPPIRRAHKDGSMPESSRPAPYIHGASMARVWEQSGVWTMLNQGVPTPQYGHSSSTNLLCPHFLLTCPIDAIVTDSKCTGSDGCGKPWFWTKGQHYHGAIPMP